MTWNSYPCEPETEVLYNGSYFTVYGWAKWMTNGAKRVRMRECIGIYNTRLFASRAGKRWLKARRKA